MNGPKTNLVTTTRNSQGGWTVRYPSIENPGLFHERPFTPAVGYSCRSEALAFARLQKHNRND